MPVCPFCRKSVELNSIWCNCGANLSRFPSIPISNSEVREWLVRHVPDMLHVPVYNESSLLEQARQKLLETQEAEISDGTKRQAEIAQLRSSLSGFLADCAKAEIDPTVDIGALRRDRWRQWKRIPAEYRQEAPLKSFKLTPGYIFEIRVAKFKDEFCIALDGTLYKHQLNALDPYPMDQLLKIATAEKIGESLVATLVFLLKTKQHPVDDGDQKPGDSAGDEATLAPGGLKVSFGDTAEQAHESTAAKKSPATRVAAKSATATSKPVSPS